MHESINILIIATSPTPLTQNMISVAELTRLTINNMGTDSSDDDNSNHGISLQPNSEVANRRLTFDLPVRTCLKENRRR